MKILLADKYVEAKDTLSFTFKPELKLDYSAGDFIYLPLNLKYPDPRGNIRQFSLASSPTEDELKIVTRIRKGSGYKKTLSELIIGTEIEIDPPTGILHLEENDLNTHIFIAGGVGITPFRSRIKYNIDKQCFTSYKQSFASKNKLNIPICLIYSNHSEEDIVFRNELDEWSKKLSWFKVVYIISEIQGRLTKERLGKLIKPNMNLPRAYARGIFSLRTSSVVRNPRLYSRGFLAIKNQKYWITGSPSFVDSIEEMLKKLKIKEKNIITEKFTGY